MVEMNEAVVNLMIIGLWLLGGYALFLRLFVVRRLRKRIEAMSDAALSHRAAATAPLSGDERSEFQRMQRRLEVLERIAVDKEHSLSREIESLRSDG